MRILKFRAWDNKKKRIFYPRKMEYVPAGIWWISTENIFKKKEFKEINNFRIPHPIPGSAKDVLMQFTGLLDKNKKEIYEGYIVKDNKVSPSLPNCRVIRNFIEDSYFLLQDIRDFENNPFEVIGNIYENPELI